MEIIEDNQNTIQLCKICNDTQKNKIICGKCVNGFLTHSLVLKKGLQKEIVDSKKVIKKMINEKNDKNLSNVYLLNMEIQKKKNQIKNYHDLLKCSDVVKEKLKMKISEMKKNVIKFKSQIEKNYITLQDLKRETEFLEQNINNLLPIQTKLKDKIYDLLFKSVFELEKVFPSNYYFLSDSKNENLDSEIQVQSNPKIVIHHDKDKSNYVKIKAFLSDASYYEINHYNFTLAHCLIVYSRIFSIRLPNLIQPGFFKIVSDFLESDEENHLFKTRFPNNYYVEPLLVSKEFKGNGFSLLNENLLFIKSYAKGKKFNFIFDQFLSVNTDENNTQSGLKTKKEFEIIDNYFV